MKGIKRWIVIVVTSLLIILTLFGILLWRLGLFDFTGDDASAKIIAATLALIGGLIGSVVTIIGIFLKHTLDQRNTELREDAEKRLNLETAIQAINLLSTSSGKDVSQTQRAGVLFTLANLGQEALAINLASQMVEDAKIDAKTVVWLINHSLKSDDQVARDGAVNLLSSVSCTLLVSDDDALFPLCLKEWNQMVPLNERRKGMLSFLKQILSQSYSKWPEEYIIDAIICLVTFWQKEEYLALKNTIGVCLDKMLEIYTIPLHHRLVTEGGEDVMIHKAKEEVQKLCEKQDTIITCLEYGDILTHINEWGST